MRISDWSSDVCSSDLEKERFEGLRTCPERPAIDIAVQSPSTTNVEMPSPSRTKMFGAVRAFIAASLQPVSGERIDRGNSLSHNPSSSGSCQQAGPLTPHIYPCRSTHRALPQWHYVNVTVALYKVACKAYAAHHSTDRSFEY